MTLVSYEPWSFVNRLQRQLDQAYAECCVDPARGYL
jgi:hypothetical protein